MSLTHLRTTAILLTVVTVAATACVCLGIAGAQPVAHASGLGMLAAWFAHATRRRTLSVEAIYRVGYLDGQAAERDAGRPSGTVTTLTRSAVRHSTRD